MNGAGGPKGTFEAYYRSKNGNKQLFTLRQAEQMADADFIARVVNFTLLLSVSGWTEWVDLDQVTAAERAEADGPRNNNTFEIQSIKLAAGGENPRWVVRGGNYVKYGVTCWPEILEAAGLAEKLDPLRDNKPKGLWIAHYNERLNEEGRWVPDKVTRIAKAT
jgi:hypothetical protein